MQSNILWYHVWLIHCRRRQGHNSCTEGPYRVFRGKNITELRQFLDKEELRRSEAERRNVPFLRRGDDSMDLY